ncbi:helix-turn-helix domain-containing protein [Williamsia maris]|uniref:helix-turn-helix domain-containing protein n=1 Tax=Williamsia maris TaxID=72806 RepID=UPI003556D951
MTAHSPTSAHETGSARVDLDWLRSTGVAALSRPQVAQLLDVDERTVGRAIADGSLPSMRLGRRVVVPRVPLMRLLGIAD